MVVNFLDGDYFACAQIDLPYKTKENQSCQNVSNFYYLANHMAMQFGQKMRKKAILIFAHIIVNKKLLS